MYISRIHIQFSCRTNLKQGNEGHECQAALVKLRVLLKLVQFMWLKMILKIWVINSYLLLKR